MEDFDQWWNVQGQFLTRTPKDIALMAWEAGRSVERMRVNKAVSELVQLAVENEREQCARLCEQIGDEYIGVADCISAIRERNRK